MKENKIINILEKVVFTIAFALVAFYFVMFFYIQLTMSTIPTRIQRSRAKGATTPPSAKYCGRPGKWGNPFVVNKIEANYYRVAIITVDWVLQMAAVAVFLDSGSAGFDTKEAATMHAVKCFGVLMARMPERYPVDELRQYTHLSCWCKLGEPCHVDEIIKRIKLIT